MSGCKNIGCDGVAQIESGGKNHIYVECYECAMRGPFRATESDAWAAWDSLPDTDKIAAAVAEQKRVDALCLENKIRFLNDNYDSPNHGTVGRDYTRVRINILEEVLAEIQEAAK